MDATFYLHCQQTSRTVHMEISTCKCSQKASLQICVALRLLMAVQRWAGGSCLARISCLILCNNSRHGRCWVLVIRAPRFWHCIDTVIILKEGFKKLSIYLQQFLLRQVVSAWNWDECLQSSLLYWVHKTKAKVYPPFFYSYLASMSIRTWLGLECMEPPMSTWCVSNPCRSR